MNKEVADLKTFSMTVLCWLDAQEAANQQLRISIKKLTSQNMNAPPSEGSVELPFHVENLLWTLKEGAKGPFQLSDDLDNPDHEALLTFLKSAGGSVASEGYYYWIFPDGKTIGRKPSNQVKRRP